MIECRNGRLAVGSGRIKGESPEEEEEEKRKRERERDVLLTIKEAGIFRAMRWQKPLSLSLSLSICPAHAHDDCEVGGDVMETGLHMAYVIVMVKSSSEDIM